MSNDNHQKLIDHHTMNRLLECKCYKKPHFYIHLRHSSQIIDQNVPVAVCSNIRGPYFKLERDQRDPKQHPYFTKKLEAAKFEYFKNVDCDLDSEEKVSAYFNADGQFAINGQVLEEIAHPDEIFSVLIPNREETPPPANKSSASKSLLNQSSASRRNYQPPTSPLNSTMDYTAARYEPKVINNIALSPYAHRFGVKEVTELVGLFRARELDVFDPIRFDISIWMNHFCNLMSEFKCEELFFKILPCFLERVGKAYLAYLKESSPSIKLADVRDRFIEKFKGFKCLKLQEAFEYRYANDGHLLDYYEKKLGLLRYAFPEMVETQLIACIVAGMNNRSLINEFSDFLTSDLATLKAQLTVHKQFNEFESSSFILSDSLLSDDQDRQNGSSKKKKGLLNTLAGFFGGAAEDEE